MISLRWNFNNFWKFLEISRNDRKFAKNSPRIRKRFSSTQPPPKLRRPIASAAFFHQRFFSESSKSSSIHTRIQRGNPDSRQNGIAVSVFRTPPPGRGKKPNFTRIKTRSTKFPHYLFDFSLGLSPRTFLPIKKPLFFLLIFSDKTFFARNRIFSPFSVRGYKGKTPFFRKRNFWRWFSEPPRRKRRRENFAPWT